MPRTCLAVLLAALLALMSAACGHSPRTESSRLPKVSVAPLTVRQLSAEEVAAARAELASLPIPAAADAAAFAELRAALDNILAARASGKSGSTLPNESKNGVTDAQVASDGAGGFNLT